MYKKLCALILAVVLTVLCFAGCHEKGEVVMTIDGYEIPSGLYLAVQVNSFNAFSSEVQAQLGSSTSLSDISEYFKYSLDGVSAADWIENETMETLRQYVAVERHFEKAGLTLDSEDTGMVEYYMYYYWEYYGYSSFYEANGVSEDSYKLVWENNVKSTKLFEYYYDAPDETTGLGGVYQVPDEDIINYMDENYILANRLSISTSDMEDDEIAAVNDKLEGYADRINDGTDFDTIKLEYDLETSDDTSSVAENVVDDSETESIYPSSALLYTKSSDAANYAELKLVKDKEGFEYGKAYVTDDSANGTCYLDVIYDVIKDDYYVDNYRSGVLSEMKGEEFNDLMKTAGEGYTVNSNDSLVKYYAPENIKAAA